MKLTSKKIRVLKKTKKLFPFVMRMSIGEKFLIAQQSFIELWLSAI